MSRSKFASLFTQMLGESPLAYLQQHRLRLATQHLQTGQLALQQIAHRIGYSSENSIKTFKKFYDLTPASIDSSINSQKLSSLKGLFN